ncbi:hypothetical protein JCM21900_006829 [Sporobolomyces salmonicolor]
MDVTETKIDSAPEKEEQKFENAVTNRAGCEPVEVGFSRDDPQDPQNGWTTAKRWRVLFMALFITFTSTYNSTSNGAAGKGVEEEFGISSEVFQVSGFAYQLMLGVGPLFLAPISETFGRRKMLVLLTGLITLLFLPQALAPNFASIAATRFFQGLAGSVEGPVIAGIVADLFAKRNRGRAMATFVLVVYAGNACGPTIGGWMAYKVSWRWVYWIQMCMSGVSFLLCLFFLPETRGEIILSKRVGRLEQETGRPHYVRGAVRIDSWGEAVKISATRPLVYLFTEPIVALCATWIGMAWGVVFLFTGAIPTVFKSVYGFNQGTAATVLMTGLIGALIGWIENETIQERLYRRGIEKGHGKAQPEVRLYSSAVGAFLFSAGSFGFAWTARPWIPWIAPCIFIAIANLGLYTIYLATYNYLSDVYERYSSSAQAAQSLLRGVMGACFPFFGNIMYTKLTYKWASSLVGFVALGFCIVPWLVIIYGPEFRAKSKVARALANEEGDILGDEPDVVAAV